LKKVFLQELLPHKTTLDTVRETLLKVIEKVKAGISRFSMFKKISCGMHVGHLHLYSDNMGASHWTVILQVH
jgi:hypothetical protein